MTAAMMTTTGTPRRQGRRATVAVAADAAASGVVGAVLLAGAGGLDSAFGASAGVLLTAGAALLGWAVALGVIARRGRVSARTLRAIVGLNAGWVVASVALSILGWNGSTALGTAFVLAQAIAVAGLGELQVMALRSAGRPAA